METRATCGRKPILYTCVGLTVLYFLQMHLQDSPNRLLKLRPNLELAKQTENELQPKNESASEILISAFSDILKISSVTRNSQLSVERLPLLKVEEDIVLSPTDTSTRTSFQTDRRNVAPVLEQATAEHAERPLLTSLHPAVSDQTQPIIRSPTSSQPIHATQAHADETHVSANQTPSPGTQDRASASNTSRTEPRALIPSPGGDEASTLIPDAPTREPPKSPSRQKPLLSTLSPPWTSASPARRLLPSASTSIALESRRNGIPSETPDPSVAQRHDTHVNASSSNSSVQKVALPSPKARVPPTTAPPISNASQTVKNKACERPWVTLFMAGRLGNQICEYAHLMMMQIEYGAQVYLMPPMYIKLHRPFPNISIKVKPNECNATKPKTFSWDKLDAKLRAEGSLNTSAAIVGYPCDMGRLWKYRATWKKEFAFSDSIRQKNQQRMNKVLQVWRQRQGNSTNQNGGEVNPVVVGVHVRRTDYIKYIARKTGGGAPPGLKYYNNAFDYYRKKFGLVAFVVSSDDRAWCRAHLQKTHRDVVVSPMGTFEEDLGLLASTAHVVTSVGTFGMWAGLLAQGSLTYPSKVGKKMEYFLTTSLNQLYSPDLIPISQK